MTNQEIVLKKSLELVKEGVLESTGVIADVIMNGMKMTIELPEPIHTFAVWKEMGYIVKKGQKAITSINIWKYTSKMLNEETGNDAVDAMNKQINEQGGKTSMFMKTAYFFKASQVEKMKEGV